MNGVDILTMRDIPMGEEEGPEGSGRKNFKRYILNYFFNKKEFYDSRSPSFRSFLLATCWNPIGFSIWNNNNKAIPNASLQLI